MQKGIVNIYLVVAVIAALAIGGFIYSKKSSPTKTETTPVVTQSTASDDILNWKTYSSAENKFSLKYPRNLEVEKNDFGKHKPIIFSSEYNEPWLKYFNFLIVVHKVESDTDLKSWLNNYVIQDLPSNKKGSIVKGDVVPYNNENIEGFTFDGGISSESKYIFFEKNNNIYEIELSGSGTGGSYKENPNGVELLNRILSTFRFTDSENTTSWKTYSDQLISFKYPANWKLQKQSQNVVPFSSINNAFNVSKDAEQITIINPDNYQAVSFTVFDKPNVGITEIINNMEKMSQGGEFFKRKELNVNGITMGAYRWSGQNSYNWYLLTSMNNKMVEINLFTDEEIDGLENKILSTFKFTN